MTQQNAGNAQELAAGAEETASQVASLRDLTNQGGSGMAAPLPNSSPPPTHAPQPSPALATQNGSQHPPANMAAPPQRERVAAAASSGGGDDGGFPLDDDDSIASF